MAWLISVECFHGSLNRIHVEFEKESSLELQEGLCNHGVRQFQCWPLSFDKFSEYVLLLEAVPMAGASKFSLHKLRLTIIRSLRLVYALDRVNWLNLLYAPYTVVAAAATSKIDWQLTSSAFMHRDNCFFFIIILFIWVESWLGVW